MSDPERNEKAPEAGATKHRYEWRQTDKIYTDLVSLETGVEIGCVHNWYGEDRCSVRLYLNGIPDTEIEISPELVAHFDDSNRTLTVDGGLPMEEAKAFLEAYVEEHWDELSKIEKI